MNNTSLANHLNENFICTFKQVSVFSTHTVDQEHAHLRGNVVKNGGNIASYFCDSDGRVIEFIVGPVPASRLRTCSKRAIKLLEKLSTVSKSRRAEIAKQHYINLCGTEAVDRVQFFLDTFSQLRMLPPSNTTPSSVNDVARATLFTIEEILNGYPHSWRNTRSAEFPEVIPARRAQFDNQPSWNSTRARGEKIDALFRENLLLAYRPLINIAKIEKPVFQILVGQRYVVTSPDYQEKLSEFKRHTDDGKCILLILLDSPQRQSSAFREPDVDKFLNSNLLKKQKDDFGFLAVKHDDMFGILADMGYPPIDLTQMSEDNLRRALGFVIFNRKGEVAKLISSGERNLRVSREMKKVSDR